MIIASVCPDIYFPVSSQTAWSLIFDVVIDYACNVACGKRLVIVGAWCRLIALPKCILNQTLRKQRSGEAAPSKASRIKPNIAIWTESPKAWCAIVAKLQREADTSTRSASPSTGRTGMEKLASKYRLVVSKTESGQLSSASRILTSLGTALNGLQPLLNFVPFSLPFSTLD
jgi:hypothetical protein